MASSVVSAATGISSNSGVRSTARATSSGPGVKARRNAATPFNLLVVGHAQSGKSAYLRTLVASLVKKGGLSGSTAVSSSSAAASSSPNRSSHISTSRSRAGFGAGGRAATKVKILWEPIGGSVAPTPVPSTPLPHGIASPVPSSPLPSATPLPVAVPPGTPVFPDSTISAPTPTAARIEFMEELTTERISLRLIDTPGLVLPPAIHLYARQVAELSPAAALAQEREMETIAQRWSDPIVAFIDAQYEATLQEESKVRRNPKSPDYQTHACLYVLDAQVVMACRGLTPLDRHAFRRLTGKLNVIPVLGRSDLLTRKQLVAARKFVIDDLRASGILSSIFGFDLDLEGADQALPRAAKVGRLSGLISGNSRDEEEEDEDSAEAAEARAAAEELQRMVPFAIVNDEALDPATEEPSDLDAWGLPTRKDVPADSPLGREYSWGTVEVENPEHSDFEALLSTLFASHMEELKLKTRETYYEMWRTERLLEVRNSIRGSVRQSTATFSSVNSNQQVKTRKETGLERLVRAG